MKALEICVDSVESAMAAESGGAQRVELCSSLVEGGLTPSLGMLRAVRSRVTIPLHVMIRPRAGDFVYSDDEFAVMREDIQVAAEAGANGVVLGVLTRHDDVDVDHTRMLIELARPMEVTFHRAIDLTRDMVGALEQVIATGAERVLTSGGAPDAVAGRHMIGKLVQTSRGRIRVMAGGNVRPRNLREIARDSGADEYHAGLRHAVPGLQQEGLKRVNLSDSRVDYYTRSVVRASDVRALRQSLDVAFDGIGERPELRTAPYD